MEEKRKSVRQAIRHAVSVARSPVVLLSGGLDSLLLVALTREFDLPVISLTADWSKTQQKRLERIAADFDLTIYGYPPSLRYLAGEGDVISLVDEYSLGGAVLPVIRDFLPGTRCLAELSAERLPVFGLDFDCALVGTLRSDRHPLTGNRAPIDGGITTIGSLTIAAPLFDLEKTEVTAWADSLGLSEYVIDGTGEVEACTRCLTSDTICPATGEYLSQINWNKKEKTAEFRSRFGF